MSAMCLVSRRTCGHRAIRTTPAWLWTTAVALMWSIVLSATRVAGGEAGALWRGFAGDPQHTALSTVAAQSLDGIRWQTPVDLDPQYSGTSLLIHYGSPVVTTANTVIVPVKVGSSGGFRVEAHNGSDGALLWKAPSDYLLPPHDWTPSFNPALTPSGRLYYPGAGGTVRFRDTPDAPTGPSGQIAFYGISHYQARTLSFAKNVRINTPLTTDAAGNVFFGFEVLAPTPPLLQSGIARIDADGTGAWISAVAAVSDPAIVKVVHNSAPALSNDQSTLYVAVTTATGTGSGSGYLAALDSHTLAPVAKVRLLDVLSGRAALLPEAGTASPTVGPDGDVYFGVLGSSITANNERGWLLHFDAGLTEAKIPGAFGWDDTASIVPAAIVPSYAGASTYLVMTKYNNYVGAGGDGVNKVAVLDPNTSFVDPVSGATVMSEVLTVVGPTPDPSPGHPNAVQEWCINSAVVDPVTKSILVNNEDGRLYRWDLGSNTLSQAVALTSGVGEAYTPTLIGADGTVYAINNAVLFAVGE